MEGEVEEGWWDDGREGAKARLCGCLWMEPTGEGQAAHGLEWVLGI